ncbi:PAAR domain-containing protein [Pseudomonas sp. Bout1]|uniref:PAAR domain-containing protein n=1 Tax=Pseudomonas sp. Bout1 TaxID=3048600 RepID=UPI002AB3EA20|nr:PAAR domain-containing protein [Pseudomonas sp. Bout1]MDY7534909.1 PAAR domain-containing protein [Pseudomonas sp. Bout1]MEB0189287.1 PAAR domain-containing protein [Pseudomonas sp. Bout1]
MTDGYFIGLGDKTTCGGKVLDGDPRVNIYGLLHACAGDRVSCGKDGKTYRIVGGISHMVSHGRHVAGTLDSFSDCPCRAQLIPTVFTATYRNEKSAPPAARRTAQPASSTVTSPSVAPRQSALSPSGHSAPPVFSRVAAQEPGFYVVPKSMTREALEATLFPMRDSTVMSMFRALNPDLGDVKAGSMIVLSDPNNFQCSREEAWLMEAAAKTNDALKPLSADEADFMARHRDEITKFLGYGSTSIGVGEAMFARNLEDVKTVLRDIEALHQRAFQADGHLRSPEFFAERKRLLATLDTNLTAMTRKGIGFPDHPNLKSALGISSRSLVHSWTQAGAAGQIPGYATHIEGVSKAAKIVKYGGWIGTAIGGGASYMKVQDVCSAGSTEACKKVKFTETGSFAGGVAGGAVAGLALTGPMVAAMCVALGVPTGGLAPLVCGVVVVGAGSLASGAIGGAFGEEMAEVVYEAVK